LFQILDRSGEVLQWEGNFFLPLLAEDDLDKQVNIIKGLQDFVKVRLNVNSSEGTEMYVLSSKGYKHCLFHLGIYLEPMLTNLERLLGAPVNWSQWLSDDKVRKSMMLTNFLDF
jgi:hypothetical protein